MLEGFLQGETYLRQFRFEAFQSLLCSVCPEPTRPLHANEKILLYLSQGVELDGSHVPNPSGTNHPPRPFNVTQPQPNQ